MLKLHCISVRDVEIWKCFLNYPCIFQKAKHLKGFLSKENRMLRIGI